MKPTSILLAMAFLAVFFPRAHSAESAGNEMCIVTTDEKVEPGLTAEYEGITYGFCCRGCIREFNKDPARYVDAWQAAQLAQSTPVDQSTSVPSGTISTPDHHMATEDLRGSHEHHEADDPHDAVEMDEHHSEEAEGHDHSAHGIGTNWIAWIGRFHVVLIHFPIALLLLAAGLAWLHLVRPSAAIMSAALATTHAGTAGAIVAALLGWATWTAATYPGAETTLLVHQISGTSAAIAAVITSWLAGKTIERPTHPQAWRIGISLTAIIVAVAGHFGGSLIYGSDYFLP